MRSADESNGKRKAGGKVKPSLCTLSLRRRRRDSGAMLLAVLFLMAMMVITAMAVAPGIVQQIKRDREEEMIHRGTEYARAIKKYYKKFGRYPANLEQLDNTNQVRFLRRRFKDPLTKDGKWKLLHYGDVTMLLPGGGIPGANQPGTGGTNQLTPGTTLPQGAGNTGAGANGFGANTAPQGAQLSPGTGVGGGLVQAPVQDNLPSGSDTTTSGDTNGGSGATGGALSGLGSGQNQGTGQANNGPNGTSVQGQGGTGGNNSIFGNSGVGGQTFGGGAIVGVASVSSDPTIRIYNSKKKYSEWQFIYNPVLDRANVLLRGPYNGLTFTSQQQIGTPAGQLNQTGQQPGGLSQQPGQGQQNTGPNQPLSPGGEFPPDQNQPPQP